MCAADHDVHLNMVAHRLFLISQHVRLGPQTVRLRIHPHVGQVVGRVVDLEPNFGQRPYEIQFRDI